MYSLIKTVFHFSYTLLKVAFWLCLIILILPISVDEDNASNSPQLSTSQTIEAAQDIYYEVSGFCERVPSVCDTGSAIFHLIGQKAKAAANIAISYLNESEQIEDSELYLERD